MSETRRGYVNAESSNGVGTLTYMAPEQVVNIIYVFGLKF